MPSDNYYEKHYLRHAKQNKMEGSPKNQWFVIVNPLAGNGQGCRQWENTAETLKKHGLSIEAAFTQHKGDGIRLAKEAIKKGHRQLMALGGDGTGHEVINGIFQQTEVPPSDITYALVPCGTGNDWAREYRIPRNLDEWAKKIALCNTIQQDIGRAFYTAEGKTLERYFTNVAGMAYDGFVTRASEQNKRWVSNKAFYLFLVFKCLFSYSFSRARITFDGQSDEDEFYSINVGVCRFSGGGMQLVPHANPSDGLLALTLARRISKWGVLMATPKFYNGKIATHPQVDTYDVHHLKVEKLSGPPILFELDGEFLGEAPVEITVLPRALRVVVP